MKIKLYILSLFVAFTAHGRLETFNDSEVRSWTNHDNNTIRGKLVKYDTNRDSVYIIRPRTEGAPFWYPLNKLSANDIAFVKNEVADLNKVVLPENLYKSRIGGKNWKVFDSKYLKLDNPVSFDLKKLRENVEIRSSSRSPRNAYVIRKLECWERHNFGKYYITSNRPTAGPLGMNESNSWDTLRAILLYFGVSPGDIDKMPWFWTWEDCRDNPDEIMRAYNLNYRAGGFNEKRIKESIDMGIPVLISPRRSLFRDGHTFYIYCYNTKLGGFGVASPEGRSKNIIYFNESHKVSKCYYLDIPRK